MKKSGTWDKLYAIKQQQENNVSYYQAFSYVQKGYVAPTEAQLVCMCNKGSVEESLAMLNELNMNDLNKVLMARKDSRFGDNLLMACEVFRSGNKKAWEVVQA